MTAVEESDLGVCYIGLRSTLILQTPVPVWGSRVYADSIPQTVNGSPVVRPYVLMSYAGGGDNNGIVSNDPELLIDVLCVAETTADALAGASEIRRRLDDSGQRDRRTNGYAVSGDVTWMISTVTHDRRLHLVETIDNGATKLYHSGGRYRVQMYRR